MASFVEGLSPDEIGVASQLLLDASFKLLAVQGVCPQGHSKSLFPEEGIIHLSHALSRLKQTPGVARGVLFDINRGTGALHQWSLSLHLGPLPMLDLSTLRDRDVRAFLDAEAPPGIAHVLWAQGAGYWGDAHNIYLFLKKQALFPYSRGETSEKALDAGRNLRRLCREVWERVNHTPAILHRLLPSQREQKTFIAKFDKALMDAVAPERLAEILGAMGADLPKWLKPGHR